MSSILHHFTPSNLLFSLFGYDKGSLLLNSGDLMIKSRLSILMGEHKVKSFTYLEKETGVTRKTLASIYDGKAKGIDYSTLNALCKFFGCQVGDILVYEEGE